jgi:adenylate cyclase
MSSSGSGPKRPGAANLGGVTPEEILQEADRISASQCFRNSQRLQRFINFAVQSAVHGSLDLLKEYVLGREVFDRDSDYDPRLDSIVRVEAQRLRRKLREYYETEGAADPVLITFQAGSYVPGFAYRESLPPAWSTGTKEQLDPRTVAVLPFLNLSPEPDQEYFCDGITEDVIYMLSRSPELNVIGRASTFTFKSTNCDLREIGSRLRAGTLLEGSVRSSGNQLRISAAMLDSETGHVKWANSFDVALGEVFAIQEEIARAIATALRVRITAGGQGKLARGAPDIEAYLLYLKGRQAWNEMNVSAYRTSIRHYERAISLYPEYAAPYVGLADAYCYLALWSGMRPRAALPKAQDAALKAIQLDDDLPHAYTAAAAARLFYEWDWHGALAMAKNSTVREPCYGFGWHVYGSCLLAGGKSEEALACFQRAVELDPLSVRANRSLGWVLYLQRRYDDAEKHLTAAVTLAPNSSETRCLLAHLFVQQDCIPDALDQARRCQDTPPNPVTLGALAVCLARAGQSAEATHVVGQLLEMSTADYVDPYILVQAYLALADVSKALEFTDKMLEERTPHAVFLDIDPAFDLIRADPKFGEIVSRTKARTNSP